MDGVKFSITIDAPPERVFERLADVPTHPSWANPKAEMTMEQTSGAGSGLDSSYRSSGVFVGKPVTADISVTAFDPPRRFAIRSDQHQEGKKDVWYVNEYTLTPEGGGTRLSKRVTSNGNPLIFFIAYPAIRADQMTSLRNLKRAAETSD
ncbi:MAG TPA: SRPBCC family protein [Actinomycetota bacterium]|nr:SRPBCC family protein [Actinomycetota bacterium]